MKNYFLYLHEKNRKDQEKIFEDAYKNYYPLIKGMILKMDGDECDALDIFQDTMYHIYKEAVEKQIPIKNSLKNYIYTVSKNKWLNELTRRKNHRTSYMSHQEFLLNFDMLRQFSYEDQQDNEELKKFVSKHLNKLDSSCQKVIRLFMNNVSYRVIAVRMGYKSEHVAKNKKCHCQKKLVKKMLIDPLYNFFYS